MASFQGGFSSQDVDIPTHHKPSCGTVASYEYTGWGLNAAIKVWQQAEKIMNNLQIPYVYTINELKHIFLNHTFDIDYKEVTSNIKLMLRHNITLIAIFSLYSSNKLLSDLKKKKNSQIDK